MTSGENDAHGSPEAVQPAAASGQPSVPLAPRGQPVACLLLAAWLGLFSGLAQVALLAVKKLLLHRYTHQGPHVVWMAPVADVALFAIPGCLLFLMARRWPKLVTLRVVASVLAFLGFLSLLLMVKWLHRFAALLLAAGLAAQTARLIASHPDGLYSFARRTVRWMAALVVVLALGVQGGGVLAERRALATLPAASPHAPNVLLIVLDTVRAQSLSLYGYVRRTSPQLERLAKTGVRFDRAIATSPWTLPSHGSIFTGRFPHELSADWRIPLDAAYPTLAEILSGRGYATAAFVANTFYCSRESGLGRGFARYEDYRITPGQIALSSSLGRVITNSRTFRRIIGYYDLLNRKYAVNVNRDFLRWLSRKGPRPFFAFLNYYDAHEPYLSPEPFDVKFGPRRQRKDFVYQTDDAWRGRRWKMSAREVQVEIDAYDSSIAYLDHQIGLLFDELERRGVLDNTLVIITSDHGEEFGEHGVFRHGNSLYWPVLHVPLLISFPSRAPAGWIVPEPVTLRDLPATVLDLIRLEGGAPFPGSSLARYWDGARDSGSGVASAVLSEVSPPPRPRKRHPIAKGPMKSLVADGQHYIREGDGREELYDFETDAWEQRDLADTEKGRRALTRFRASLQTILDQAR